MRTNISTFRTPALAPAPQAATTRSREISGQDEYGVAKRDTFWLVGLMAAFAALYAIFYPLIYTSIDEASTFSMAYVMSHGSILPSSDFFPSISPIGLHGRMYRFPIGFPAVLAALTGLGWRTFFLVNPILHLAATWCFSRILLANRIPARYAALYLLYPGFALFDRTLLSDPFAASLTTIALYFLVKNRSTGAGVCLGIALAARSVSSIVAVLVIAGLIIADWRGRDTVPLWRGKAIRFAAGLAPFWCATLLYNWYTLGEIFKTAYSTDDLSLHGLAAAGPLYAFSLLLIFPGMLLAPLFYRGAFWRTALIAAASATLIASAYNQSTYGNTFLETLLSTPRQVLPVMPFFLLAYCGVLARWLPEARLRRFRAFDLAAGVLLVVALGISMLHQKYLHSLITIRAEIARALPQNSIVYANKDAYKLHQSVWDPRTYRELPSVSNAQIAADLQKSPVYVVLYIRSRGFAAEDVNNELVAKDLQTRFRLAPGPNLGSSDLQCNRVTGVQSSEGRPL